MKKILTLNEANWHIDNGNNLKITVDSETALTISGVEILEMAKLIVTENEKKMKVPGQIMKAIRETLTLKKKKRGRPPRKKKHIPASKSKSDKGLF